MLKKLYKKRVEKQYNIDVVKSYLKKFDDLCFDEVNCFYELEKKYISYLKKLDTYILNVMLKDLEYDIKRRSIKSQNSNNELDMAIITFFLSVCILYLDDCKYNRLRDFSLAGIAAFSLIFIVFFVISQITKRVSKSNEIALYIEFKTECIKKAIGDKV